MIKYLFPLLMTVGLNASAPSKANTCTFDQGDQALSCICTSYDAPASVKLSKDWEVTLGASYLYWFAGEGGLDLATTGAYSGSTVIAAATTETIVQQSFSYSSGFKVEAVGSDDSGEWVLKATYTWLNPSTSTSASAPYAGNGTPALSFTNWFFATPSMNQSLAASNLNSEWKMNLNWIDGVIERPFYSGRHLLLNPFIGLRGMWMTQSLDINAFNTLNTAVQITSVNSNNHFNSWGIGPRGGIDGRYLFKNGVRFQGEFGASLLFTHYNVHHFEDSMTPGGTNINYELNNFNILRPMIESTLGLGWGRYFSNQRYHFDLSATYDFNYLWSQNMMRSLNNIFIIGSDAAENAIFLHGLTVNGSFSF